MMDYNYIFIIDDIEYYHIAYSDLEKNDGVKIFWGDRPNNKLLYILYRLHHSSKINSYIYLPLKSLWYKTYFNDNFSRKKPLCFVFWASMIDCDYMQDFVRFLHKKYENSKYVCYYTDLVKAPGRKYVNTPNNIKALFDLIISYDIQDAEKFGFLYHPTSFSDVKIDNIHDIDCTDVYYVGKSKGRLPIIRFIYNQLTNAGFNCDFYVTDLNYNEEIQSDGIHYIKKMSYTENLVHASKSNILLEILQPNAVGCTLRTWEAINFGCCLLTNNQRIFQTGFYDNSYVSIISADNRIDIEYLKKYKKKHNNLVKKIRPIALLNFIESNFKFKK